MALRAGLTYVSVVAAILAVGALTIPSSASADATSVLQLDDRAAASLMLEMMETGDLRSKSQAEAWVVVASVALGAGIEKCGFPTPNTPNFIFEPAFDGLTEDQIFVLNRLVTKNYRESETDSYVKREALYGITKVAVVILSHSDQTWDCKEIAGIWDKAITYMRNKNDQR